MDDHIKEFFGQASDEAPHGHFHEVIALHESPDLEWESLKKKVPRLCKGWYELAHLKPNDRIEFLRDFWLSKLPYHPQSLEILTRFFNRLDDIGVFLVQRTFDDPFEANVVYSLKNKGGFFRGAPGATDEEVVELQRLFPDFIFPQDYIAFMQIHNGFSKTTDTGILEIRSLPSSYQQFEELLATEEPLISAKGQTVNPVMLLPFYESFGMPVYQCFWGEWYPESEMGNVYYSGITKTVSDVEVGDSSTDNLAFPTFIDWLFFYLEPVEV